MGQVKGVDFGRLGSDQDRMYDVRFPNNEQIFIYFLIRAGDGLAIKSFSEDLDLVTSTNMVAYSLL